MNSRVFFLAWFAAGVAAVPSSGLAADLPAPSAPVSQIVTRPAGYDWTGFYLGGNVGGNVTSNYNADTQANTTFPAPMDNSGLVPTTLDTGTGGLIGGVQAGYNYQLGKFIAGAETDIEALQAGGGSNWTSASTLLGSTFTTKASERLDYLGTLRLRAGYAPFDRWLVFGTGGLAYGGVRTSESVTMNGAPANQWNGASDQVRTGYAFGGGLEYAWSQSIILRGEYLYYNLGSTNIATTPSASAQANPALAGLVYVTKTTVAGSILRLGVDYKF